jgi:ribosomal subunit interface protein
MKISVKAVKWDLDVKTRDYAAEKVSRLEKYYKNVISATIVLEEHPGDTANVRFCAKTRLSIPGNDIFAEACGRDFKSVIDETGKKLKEQLVKAKESKNPSRIHRAKSWVKGFFGRE